MTELISVVTAVHAPAAPYLPQAYASLAAQVLPPGWDWQWVVQADGPGEEVARLLPADPRISFRQGRAGGAAVARTLALARVRGRLVKVLDADDVLTPGALARDLAVLRTRPDVTWTTCRALDLLPDGSTVGFDQDPPEGPIERGAVLAHWRAHDFRAPVHPATLCVRREVLLALGGWLALPASEDTGLLMALGEVGRGWFVAETGLLYRKWPGQSTGQAAHADAEERAARAAVVEARARALRGLAGWRVGEAGASARPSVGRQRGEGVSRSSSG
ncbi:glycosyltransferase family 2 protein [Allostreptomyces psammosilenae]|uniref:Glycosyltransferase involved in cell wall biosynthesis n=1 Tax=Allostreptomyces psammosilenae TaxID=1892865 RepID=A0A852ZT56_9ACTN|nr:glycosyltransferase [Allostreptomyces psammosilenae]NYI05519.1 glycosyltransferase involved in cell wall biosynthesis [Allostreptomyces psammosilenae]